MIAQNSQTASVADSFDDSYETAKLTYEPLLYLQHLDHEMFHGAFI